MSVRSFTEISAWPVPNLCLGLVVEDDWENVHISIFFLNSILFSLFPLLHRKYTFFWNTLASASDSPLLSVMYLSMLFLFVANNILSIWLSSTLKSHDSQHPKSGLRSSHHPTAVSSFKISCLLPFLYFFYHNTVRKQITNLHNSKLRQKNKIQGENEGDTKKGLKQEK